MDIFDMEITEESLYTLDSMLESVDAQQDVIRAIHKYEMLTIHTESMSDEVLMEAANNVFDRIITAIKKVFKTVITFVQNMIKNMKTKLKKIQMILRKKSGKSVSQYKPDFTIYDYSGMPGERISMLPWCLKPYENVTSQLSITAYSMSARAKGFEPTFDGYRAHTRVRGDKDLDEYFALGTTEEAKSYALMTIIDDLNIKGVKNNRLHSGEEISDISAFLTDLPGIFRGREIETAQAVTASVEIDIVYDRGIKNVEKAERELTSKHRTIVDNMQRLKNTANEVGGKDSISDSARDSYDFAMRLANTVTNNINATLRIAMNVLNIYSKLLDEQVAQNVRLLDEMNYTDLSDTLKDLK